MAAVPFVAGLLVGMLVLGSPSAACDCPAPAAAAPSASSGASAPCPPPARPQPATQTGGCSAPAACTSGTEQPASCVQPTIIPTINTDDHYVHATIACQNGHVMVQFVATAGTTYHIETDLDEPAVAGSLLASDMRLLSSSTVDTGRGGTCEGNCLQEAQGDADHGMGESAFDFACETAGTYYIQVTGEKGHSGHFRLKVNAV